MSRYLNFYIRNKNSYLSIASFCGSSSYMEAFDDKVPSYSGVAPVTRELLGTIQAEAKERIANDKKSIEKWNKEKEQILQASNSLEEKMEYIYSEESVINEVEDDIKAWTSVQYFIDFLYNILEEGEYGYVYNKKGHYKNDANKYLYVGIEPMKVKDVDELTEEDRKDWI